MPKQLTMTKMIQQYDDIIIFVLEPIQPQQMIVLTFTNQKNNVHCFWK